MTNPWRPISTFDQPDGVDVDIWVEIPGQPWLSYRVPDVMRVHGEWFWKSGAFMAKLDNVRYWMPRPPKPEGAYVG